MDFYRKATLADDLNILGTLTTHYTFFRPTFYATFIMLRNFFLFAFLLASTTTFFAQAAFNTTFRDSLTFPSGLNDVWGYVAPDGTEYALVGRNDGLSVVSLADPDDIVEVAFVGGANSTWRDIKTFGTYAYIVADEGTDGILAIDLSNLPTSVSSEFFTSGTIPGANLGRAHNIYIDEPTGLAYVAGANINSGGMVIYDVATTPGTPIFEAFAPSVYAHDVYVANGVMYASEIFVGNLTLYDVSDPMNIQQMGTQATPRTFTHNAWTPATGDYVYTTDERGDASTAAYDISDPLDIQLLDEFRPRRSLGRGTIPHNVHVLNDYLVISHYTDGVEIVDASVPDILVEVAYYDHWYGGDGGFSGSWGAYPFLPSGLVLSSDIDNGLFVIDVNYQRAARLRGIVTDAVTANVLNNATVTITSAEGVTTTTDALGAYKMGLVTAGDYTVTYSLPGYITKTFTINFSNGVEQMMDVALEPKASTTISGGVTSTATNAGIPNAEVNLVGEDGTFTAITDGSGNITISNIFTGDYVAFVGKWGFENSAVDVTVTESGTINLQMTPGYLDGFAIDQGWTVTSNAGSGDWVREVPNGTFYQGATSNPDQDVDGGTDLGNIAYVTGNSAAGSAGTDDVDNGNTTLLSPAFDPAFFGVLNDVQINFSYWFFNAGGSSLANDSLEIFLDNGSEREVVRMFYSNAQDSNTPTSTWVPASVSLSELTIPLTATMSFGAIISDVGNGHLVEGGIDDFSIVQGNSLPVDLVEFTATRLGKQSARLSWTTATEVGSDYFDVERSTDGVEFSAIGRLAAAGNSEHVEEYRFDDERGLAGRNFYRLRQVDLDGQTTFSEVRLVTLEGASEKVLAWPNPAEEFLKLSSSFSGPIIIYRQNGALVGQQQLATGQAIDVSQLPAGYYLLRAGEEVIPFVKR
ncbi:MAG: choice-of-anchor B domain-containing protein [Neolewinella sp.]